MQILVINSGSSSIKFSLFESGMGEPRSLFDGEVTGIGSAKAGFKFRDADGRDLSGGRKEIRAVTTGEAIGLVVEAVGGAGFPGVDAVGYRVVHPGAKLDRHQRITPEVMRDLEEAVVFAPLHDPAVIAVIRAMMERFPDVAALCVLRYSVSRDDAGGGDYICDSGGVSGARRATVWVSWIELCFGSQPGEPLRVGTSETTRRARYYRDLFVQLAHDGPLSLARTGDACRKIEIRITVYRAHASLPVLVDFRPDGDIGDIERRHDFELWAARSPPHVKPHWAHYGPDAASLSRRLDWRAT